MEDVTEASTIPLVSYFLATTFELDFIKKKLYTSAMSFREPHLASPF